jgi:putative PIN family toxin of toxin-antitoxin system
MRVIVDTNVFISGIFFAGPSSRILEGWRDGKVNLILSPEILGEYQEVAHRLSSKFKGVDIDALIELVAIESTIISSPPLKKQVCRDKDDDKFIACAIASKTPVIISGDKDLLDISGHEDIEIIKPRSFVERYLRS